MHKIPIASRRRGHAWKFEKSRLEVCRVCRYAIKARVSRILLRVWIASRGRLMFEKSRLKGL